MRFIIREQEYEQLVAAGRLKYRSGALESWRFTEAVDGFLVMRVDLDRRDAGAASSILIHLLLDKDGRLERAKLRDFSPEGDVSVDVLVDQDSLSVSEPDSNGIGHYDVDLQPGSGVILPGLVSMALFIRPTDRVQDRSAIVLDPDRRYAPQEQSVEISMLEEESLTVTGQTVAVRPYLIRRDGMSQTIWLDKYGLPVRADDEEGLRALEDRYVRHR